MAEKLQKIKDKIAKLDHSLAKRDKRVSLGTKLGLALAATGAAVYACGVSKDDPEVVKAANENMALVFSFLGVSMMGDGEHTLGYRVASRVAKTTHLRLRALKDVAQEAFKNLGKRVSQTLEQAKAKAAARRSEGIELVVKRPGEKEYILDQKGSNFVRKPATNPLAMMKQGRQGR